MMHLLNPDRQQAGSYKGLRTSSIVSECITFFNALLTAH
jgi:hypothetical protein